MILLQQALLPRGRAFIQGGCGLAWCPIAISRCAHSVSHIPDWIDPEPV